MVRTKNQSSSSSASSSTKSPAKISGSGGGGGNNRSRSCSDALIDDGKSSSKLSSNRQRSSGTTTTTIASTPGSSPDDDTTDADLTPTSGNAPRSSGGNSVHKQNLYVVSFPIIFLFNVLRSLIYQLFCIFRYLYGASTKVIYRSPHRRDCNIEIVVQNSKDQHQQALICPLERGDDGSHESQRAQHILPQRRLQPLEMSGNRGGGSASSGYSPGPGDPLLAKQKHHHRRAFEYISKALKIDEENEGKYNGSRQRELAGGAGGLHWFRLRFHCVAAAGVVLHESSHAVLALFVVFVVRESIPAYTNTHLESNAHI